ncbi:MAG TPA: hypothetical protein VFU37_18640 [Pyrinomonadaceae bacterium]|nr:hypothetical protein [Pyrinomonadaceae bacterium]
MNTPRSVKLIKDGKRNNPTIRAEAEAITGPNRWSKAVRSWVIEFREREHNESLPSFDSLFKDGSATLGRN